MKHLYRLVPLALAASMVGACSKKQPEKAAGEPEEDARNPSAVSSTPPTTTGRLDNPYAKENWPELESAPESDGEVAFEQAATVQEKLEVIGQMQAIGPDELAPVVRRALLHPDENLRVEAVQATGVMFTTPELATDVITGATFDPSEEVRAISLEMILEQHPDARIELFGNAIDSPYPDVRNNAALELGRMSTKPGLETLFRGLSSPSIEFSNRVSDEIYGLINERFTSREQAEDWWAANAAKHDERLNRIAE